MVDDRQADAQADDNRLGCIADAEPQHNDRHQGGLGNGINEHQQRIAERGDPWAARHGQSDGYRNEQGQHEAGQHAPQRGGDIEERLAVAEDCRELAQGIVSRRQAIDVKDTRGAFPPRQQGEASEQWRHRRGGGDLEAHCRPWPWVSISPSISTTKVWYRLSTSNSARRRGRGRSMSIIALMRPGERVSTTTRSDRKTASSTLWVTNSTVLRSRSQISSSSRCKPVRVCASSAPKGSSISRIFGP